MDSEQIEYVWKNYRYLIDRETGYSKYLRAGLFSINSSWPDVAEIEFLQKKYSRAELVERFQAIDRKREFHALTVCEKYSAEIYFNYCSSCGALAVAPGSERCITCGFTWYGTNSHRRNS